MQKVEIVLRAIGIPSDDGSIVSGKDTKEYLEYQYLSKDYKLKSEHYLGPVKGKEGTDDGYRVLFILTKDENVPQVVHQGVVTADSTKKSKE